MTESGYLTFAVLSALLVLLAAVVVLHRRRGMPPGQGDDDSDGGDGGTRRPDPPLVGPPRSGLPLPDAEPASRRYQGTRRTTLIPARARRPVRDPQRPRVPASSR